MRLFVALDIAPNVRQQLAEFHQRVQAFAPDARWSRVEGLHVTLKFIGEQPAERLPAIAEALRSVHAAPIMLSVCGVGFFPDATRARVFWAGVNAGQDLAVLARAVDLALKSLGIPAEEHEYRPHLTLARTGSGRPQTCRADRRTPNFASLQQHLLASPTLDFGTITAREFFLYQSQLGPGGSAYLKVNSFPLL